MAAAAPRPFRRRRWRWRRLIEEHTLLRHPVSSTRHRLSLIILLLLFLGLAWYALITRDAAIRRRAVEFLMQVTAGEVRVDRARFEMFDGITLYGVRVSVPYDRDFDALAVDTKSREIFTAASVKLIHNPWRLLLGSFRVDRIIATMPRLVLAQNVDTGIRNWQLLGAKERTRRSEAPSYRPEIALRSATTEVVSLHADGRRESSTLTLDVDARPHRQIRTAFSIEVRRLTDPAERTTVVFDPGARLVANTPFVDVETVRLQLPKPAQEFFARVALQGQVKLSRLVYDAAVPENRDTAVELRNVRCAVPLSMLRSGSTTSAGGMPASEQACSGPTADPGQADSQAMPGGDAVVAITDVQGHFDLRGGRLDMDITGLVDGAKYALTGALDNVGASLDRVGIDLRIRGTNVPAPEGALREQLRTDPAVPWEVRCFINDYDPHGNFDLDFQVDRPAEGGNPAAKAAGSSDRRLNLTGVLRPQGVQVRCRWFPYPVEEVRGLVRFDGRQVYLEKVEASHGTARLRADGRIDRTTWYPSVDVEIVAKSVALDADLFEPLAEPFKSMWQRFNPRGAADITVRVRRPGAGQNDPWPTFQTAVAAEFADAAMCFADYPYPFERVHGRVEIAGDRLEFVGLTGHRNDASVRIDGFATLAGEAGPSTNECGTGILPVAEVRIEAVALRLDETLAAALPPEARVAFAQFQPAGSLDLLGTVSSQNDRGELVYDLRAKLHDATLCYQPFPYRLHGVEAEVAIRPDHIAIVRAAGRHGTAEVSVTGNVRRKDEGFIADLTLECRRMSVDQDLHESLPPALREAWRLLEPTGLIDARSTLHYVSEDGRTWQRHRTEIELTDGGVRFTGFPLPLSGVNARLLVKDDQVEIHEAHGRAGDGEVTIQGNLDLAEPGKRGTLTLAAKDLALTEELLAALPEALSARLKSIKPAGRIGLRLDPLQFDIAEDGKARWDFAGELQLADARGNLGFELRHATGAVTGRGAVLEDGGVELAADCRLAHVEIGGWHLDDVVARITADPASKQVLIEDALATAYGGEATGYAEIDLSGKRPSYQLAVTGRDVQLNRYLAIHGRAAGGMAAALGGHAVAGADSRPIRGSVSGNLVLRGYGGENAGREGAGEVFVQEAQIWKLPVGLAMFQLLNLTPDENAFHDGWIKYSLAGDELTLNQIDLQGSAVSFIGGGRVNLRTRRLDVNLVAGSAVRMNVPILSELLEGATRELMELQVAGTIDSPRITPVPLKSAAEALKTLFPEPPPQPHDSTRELRGRSP